MKGVILAGGAGTRLAPITNIVCKQLFPVYDKPMIYYPLSTLMLAGIRDVLIISTPHDIPFFERLFGDGDEFGISIEYAVQAAPRGIADAFIVGRDFIGDENVCLILGDNIFHGDGLAKKLKYEITNLSGATIFGYRVNDPQRYGIIEIDWSNKILSLEEKPENPKSNIAATGLYLYKNSVVDKVKNVIPSGRGELEITDLNKIYLSEKSLDCSILGRGYAWLDTGTFNSLVDASNFVKIIEERQGLKIACIEEISFNNGWIDIYQLERLASRIKGSTYGKYLLGCCVK